MRRHLSCFFLSIASLTACLPAFAREIVVPPGEGGAFPDTEVSTNIAFNVKRTDVDFFEVSFSLMCTTSNNLQVAFGRDEDADGVLSFPETAVLYGWRNGRCYVEDVLGAQRREAEVRHGNGAMHKFCVKLHLGRSHQIKSFSATFDKSVVFPDFSEERPAWLHSPRWNLMRITRRGSSSPAEWFSCEISYRALFLTVR